MSLLDKGNTVLVVYPSVVETDQWGNETRVPGTEGYVVRGSLQSSTSEELAALGQVALTTVRFISRDWPGDPWARITNPETGDTYDQFGEPRFYSASPATSHYTTYLKKRGEY